MEEQKPETVPVEEIQEQVEEIQAEQKPVGPGFKDKVKARWQRFKEFVQECKRVLLVTKKPTKEEFRTIFKISGLGMLIIGFIGFLIHLVNQFLF